jgi:hypothetical protein
VFKNSAVDTPFSKSDSHKTSSLQIEDARARKTLPKQEVVMNGNQTMKTIANIQFTIALLSALLFILPSLFGFFTVYLILPVILVWSIGIRLMRGYSDISEGNRSISESRGLWFATLIFNAIGVFIGVLWLNGNNYPVEDNFGLVPGILSCIFAIIGLLIPAEKSQILESQHQINS